MTYARSGINAGVVSESNHCDSPVQGASISLGERHVNGPKSV